MKKLLPIICLFVSGCISLQPGATRNIPNVHIAYATLVPHVELDSVPDLKKYRLDRIVKGRFVIDDHVFVGFSKDTLPSNGLPEKAILILHLGVADATPYNEALAVAQGTDDFSLRLYTAYRANAQMGILPDTPENRRYVHNVSLNALGSTPRSRRLQKATALTIARKHVMENEPSGVTVEACATREPYGWSIFCDILQSDGGQYIGDHCIVRISDEGRITEVIPGL